MPHPRQLHPRYAGELRRLARQEIGPAEALRRLIRTAESLGQPRPTYWTVRRFLAAERAELERRHRQRERFEELVVRRVLTGRVPRME